MPINNKTKDILRIAKDVLGAKIAVAKKDVPGAIAQLNEAITIQDSLKYGEPPDWFYPVRESLGALLLMNNKPAEAEKIFRDDLARMPRNPRSLSGRREALKAKPRDQDAQCADQQFRTAWRGGAKRTRQNLT